MTVSNNSDHNRLPFKAGQEHKIGKDVYTVISVKKRGKMVLESKNDLDLGDSTHVLINGHGFKIRQQTKNRLVLKAVPLPRGGSQPKVVAVEEQPEKVCEHCKTPLADNAENIYNCDICGKLGCEHCLSLWPGKIHSNPPCSK